MTDWEWRRQELRERAGLYRSQPDTPQITQQLEREQYQELLRMGIPPKVPLPTSARQRKAIRAAANAKAKSKRKPKGQPRTGRRKATN